MIYLQEHEFDVDLINFSKIVTGFNSIKWMHAIEEELKSMYKNNVWDLLELLAGCKPVRCKWVFKIKHMTQGEIEWYKARLVAKGYTQREGVNYKETFSLVSTKDSF